MFDFSEQTAIVTGATRGIGRAITHALLHQGATVLGIYGGNTRAAEELSHEYKRFNGRLQLFRCDISDEQQVQAFYSAVEQSYPAVDILVNCGEIPLWP